MKVRERAAVSPTAIVVVGLAMTGLYVMSVLLLMSKSTYDSWGALLLGPLLIAITLPAFARQAAREHDRRLFWLLFVALLLKLGGTLARYYVAFGLYGGGADAQAYFESGVRISDRFLSGNFDTGLPSLTGTDFIELFTGLIFTITRPTLLGGFVVYSWLAFLGTFLFYRAFVLAVPEGRPRTYARLLFFIPSMIFWPSSIGKESWMVFALGIAAFGIARILTGTIWRGLAWAGVGMWLVSIVRPHIAGMMALGLVFAHVIRRSPRKHRELAPIFKGVSLAVLAVAAAFLVVRAQRFLQTESLAEALRFTAERTGKGGSEFQPATLLSPARAPIAILTVLFRPTIADATNFQSLIAALEGTFLFVLSVVRIRWIVTAARSIRRQPYVAFAVIYTAILIVGLSAFSNFGLLSRERVQLLPIFLILLSSPPRNQREPAEARGAEVARAVLPGHSGRR